ncbi:MAG: hypothetical protein QM808_16255 [Steroidobacteraceae bacterium]
MTRIERRFDSIAGYAKKAGAAMGVAFSAGFFKEGILSAIEFGDSIGKAAIKSGIAAEQISALSYATKQLGDIELPQLSDALKKMQVNLVGGSDAFGNIGLHIDDLRRLSPEKQFELIAQRISEIQDPSEKTAAAVGIFGKAGADLLPVFAEGAAGIRKYTEEARKFGIALDENMVKTLQEGDEAIKKLSATWDGFMRSVAVSTLRVAQALNVIDKDKIGEIKDQIAQARLAMGEMSAAGVSTSSEAFKEADARVAELEKRLERIRIGGGGAVRGGKGAFKPTNNSIIIDHEAEEKAAKAAAEALKAKRDALDFVTVSAERGKNAAYEYAMAWAEINDAAAMAFQRQKDAIDEVTLTAEQSYGALIRDATNYKELLEQYPEVYRQMIEAQKEQLSEAQKANEAIRGQMSKTEQYSQEINRAIYADFHDLFMNMGKGADNFGEHLKYTLRSIVADGLTNSIFSSIGGVSSWMATLFNAKGNVFDHGLIKGFSNGGLFNSPTGFTYGSGQLGVLGEAGPEAIMPLSRGRDGRLGIAGGTHTVIEHTQNNYFYAGSDIELRREMPELLRSTRQQIVSDIISLRRRGR